MAKGRQQRRGEANKPKGTYDTKTGPLQKPYDTIIKENAMFEKYYKQLNLMDESEWSVFLDTLRKPLPITFRITSYKSFAQEILDILKNKHFKYLDEITRSNPAEVIEASLNKGSSLLAHSAKANEPAFVEGRSIYRCLSWYPNEMAWEVELSRNDVRKNAHFEEFKQFLIHQTDNGNINRQEAVSMIPPLLLNAEPHHKVSRPPLDMTLTSGDLELVRWFLQRSWTCAPRRAPRRPSSSSSCTRTSRTRSRRAWSSPTTLTTSAATCSCISSSGWRVPTS